MTLESSGERARQHNLSRAACRQRSGWQGATVGPPVIEAIDFVMLVDDISVTICSSTTQVIARLGSIQDTFGNQLTETPLMHLAGAAKGPSHDYRLDRKHPVGHKEARRIANSHGLVVDELIAIVREKDTTPLAGTNAHASYLSRRFDPNEVVRCQDLFPEGRACIFVHRSVFLSDESIVAHLTHELYEIQGIKKAMANAGGFMNAQDFHELIREGKRGNLHDLAWDEANRVVKR